MKIVRLKKFIFLAALLTAGCVNVDPDTGQVIPRGDQKHMFAYVEARADQLREGMTKTEALILLGSPAETSKNGSVWVYLPERPAVLLPSRALRLEFNDQYLVEYGYRPIVLGQEL